MMRSRSWKRNFRYVNKFDGSKQLFAKEYCLFFAHVLEQQEASKARETRLRKAGIQSRARIASELRAMDNEVAAVSRALAVKTLQLEAEFVFAALEAEALDTLVCAIIYNSSCNLFKKNLYIYGYIGSLN